MRNLKASITSLLLFTSIAGFCQVEFQLNSCITPNCNVLFSLVENNISIKGLDPGSNTVLVSSTGKTEKVSNTEFIVITKSSSSDTLTLFVNGKKVLHQFFDVELVQDPNARIGVSPDTVLSKDEIIANPYLKVQYGNSGFRSGIHITSYYLEIIDQNQEIYFFDKRGNQLTSDIINIVRQLKPGSTLVFYKIKAIQNTSVSKYLPNFNVTIK